MESEILSLVALVIATASVIVNYLLFRASDDPAVVVYAAHDPRRPSIVNLVIQNVGRGLAYNIHFTADQPIPKSAFGIEKAPSKKPAKAMTSGPLRKLPRQLEHAKGEDFSFSSCLA